MLVDRGAKVIGLGALIAPATVGGSWLVEQLPPGVTVTNGNAYTAAVLRSNVLDVVRELALNRPAHVAVLGSTGSVGGVLSRLLANSGLHLTLIGRGGARVRQVLGDLAAVARFSEELADVGKADVIVVLTNAASARLTPNLIRDGAVVVDASEPANVSEEDARAWSPRIRVMRGGRVRIPDYHSTYDFGLEDPTETFACLAETYLFSLDGIHEHSVGVPSPSLAERLERVALRRGIHPSFTSAQWGDTAATVLQASARRAL
jgi:fatty aldehyde-generating acyl-ACP reductase